MRLHKIRAELAAAMKEHGYNEYASVPDDPHLPAFVVGMPTEIRYVRTYAGGEEIDLPVFVVVARADLEDAQVRLDAAVSTDDDPDVDVRPVHPTLMRHDTDLWNGLDMRCVGCESVDLGSAKALAAQFSLTIYT